MRVMFIYCGGCNPVIDRTGLVSKLLAVLRENEQVELVKKDGVADLAILVCGCLNACVDTTGIAARADRIIAVGGTSVDHLPCRKDKLIEVVLKKIFSYLN